ncbi:MAG: pantoate--beta-alanine ligase [Acidimicrobiia bacterium]
MKVVETFEEVRESSRGKTSLVPTMGYLHEGHLSLMAAARRTSDTVAASLFVNPLQFNEQKDLDRYPRDLDRDGRLAEEAGVDLLFAPPIEVMYPSPPLTRVSVPALESGMEGAHRPGHFEGMATVVAKLLGGIQPDAAYFGRKDAQQLAVVRRLVFDLSFPVEIRGVSTVRESDGLALSSRNIFLTGEERDRALDISRGLMAAADAFEEGVQDADTLESIVREQVAGLDVDYVTMADALTTARLPEVDREAFLAVAVRVGATRLIDNLAFAIEASGALSVDRGVRLANPSILYGDRHALDH